MRILLLIVFCNLMAFHAAQSQNVRFLFSVSNVGNTSTVTIKAQAIAGTGNNLTGFTTYLYYDNAKATVTGFDPSPIAGAPYNWGIGNQSFVNFFPELNFSVPITHNGYFFYQNFDQSFLGFSVPTGAPVTLLTITFNIISDNGGDVFLAGTAQVPAMVYVDNIPNGHPVITLGNQIMALPLELLSFTAQPQHSAIALNWTSQHEVAFAGFELQKAEDVEDPIFEKLDWIAGKGLADSGLNQYAYIDHAVAAGSSYYYRLKMIDLDGSFKYSNIVTASMDENGIRYTVTPNPSKGIFQIEYDASSDRKIELFVHNAKGQHVKTAAWFCEKGTNQFALDLENQPAGVYYLSFAHAQSTKQVIALELID
ncbi:MAG: T9SS type A sorting domain-containing protein [Saprospiraceae bacterium]|nr:T9SS type A sorting domain-containing protein [Saprospiraceae bacterium]